MKKMYYLVSMVTYYDLSLEELTKILQKIESIDNYVADVKEIGRCIDEDGFFEGAYYIKIESSCGFNEPDNKAFESLVSDLKTVVRSIEEES